jgi:DnaJ-class molecular chaperone
MQYHPDRNPQKKKESEETFKAITQAYSILSNRLQRASYDATGETAHSPAAAAAAARRAEPFGGVGYDHRPLSPEEAEELASFIFQRRRAAAAAHETMDSRPRHSAMILRMIRSLLSRLPF